MTSQEQAHGTGNRLDQQRPLTRYNRRTGYKLVVHPLHPPEPGRIRLNELEMVAQVIELEDSPGERARLAMLLEAKP